MQTSSFLHSFKTHGAPLSGKLRQPKSYNFVTNHKTLVVKMVFKKDGSSGKMVDENMIVLRERIRQMKQVGGGDGDRLPDNWMKWEKAYTCSGCYYSDVYEAVAFLQRFLIESRPSVAVGLVVLFVFGGSMAGLTVVQWLMNLVPVLK
ncbi:hypothetical protein SSX86_017569 [Deinandra increscens subsp. villosa]|uniref:Uncharacterized protein n=1 Tax=Deinandra increscens subsp. villosa TaxID=3103831 RepID=A0AAP0D0B9_9ASTR